MLGIDFTASGEAAGAYAPVQGANHDLAPVVKVGGLTAVNTGAAAATVIVREGDYAGTNTGRVLACGTVPAQSGTNPGVLDLSYCSLRESKNGLHFEVDGTASATVWVL